MRLTAPSLSITGNFIHPWCVKFLSAYTSLLATKLFHPPPPPIIIRYMLCCRSLILIARMLNLIMPLLCTA
jgi:hypothetical protein